MSFDVIIRGGTVVDGTRAPAYQADVGVRKDRIAAIGDLGSATARIEIDAKHQVIAPGFIDVHNHSDGWLLRSAHLPAKTLQGFTTEVLMADGISYAPVTPHNAPEWIYYLRSLNALRISDYDGWTSLDDYMQRVDGTSVHNAAFHVPYANVRSVVCGFGPQPVDDYQMQRIQREIRLGMQAGAVGLSTGLDYIVQCHSSTDELVRACQALTEFQGLYVTHMRYKLGLLPAIREAAEICQRAQIPLHISHLKRVPPYTDDEIFSCLDTVQKTVDLSFDVYPYQASSTMLSFLLPYEVWKDGPLAALGNLSKPETRRRCAEGAAANQMRFDQIHVAWVLSRDNEHLIGLSLEQIASQRGVAPHEVMFDLLLEENMAVLCVIHGQDDHATLPFIQHECAVIGTDGIYFPDGQVHPRMYGTTGRILGQFVREGHFPLEDAIYKLTGFPAQRFGLANRGEVREQAFADLVVFDPDQMHDEATLRQPHQPCVGVKHVLVNGHTIVTDGSPIQNFDTLPGRRINREH